MPLTCKSCLAGELVLQDAQTKNVSVINIIDGIAAGTLPLLINRLTVMFNLTRQELDPADYQLSIQVTINEQILAKAPFAISFDAGTKARAITAFSGIFVPNPGVLHIKLVEGEVVVGDCEIEISTATKPITSSQVT